MSTIRSFQVLCLAILTALFWAIQHPAQNPFYRALDATFFQAFLIANMVVLVISFCLLVATLIFSRQTIAEVHHTPNRFYHLSIAALFSAFSFASYAFAQSQLDGPLISLILNTSPMAALLAAAIKFSGSGGFFSGLKTPLQLLKSVVGDKHFKKHVGFAIIVIIGALLAQRSTFIQDDGGLSFEFSWITIAAAIAAFCVPFFFFLSSNYIAAHFSKTRRSQIVADIAASTISSIILSAAIYFTFGFSLDQIQSIDERLIYLFVFGAASLSVFARITHHLLLRLSQDEYNKSALWFHTVPLFSVIVAFALGVIFVDINFYYDKFYLISGIIIIMIILKGHNGEYKERKGTDF